MAYYEQKCHTPYALARKAMVWQVAWLQAQGGGQAQVPANRALPTWSPLSFGVLKVNVHGLLRKHADLGAMGMVIRDFASSTLQASNGGAMLGHGVTVAAPNFFKM